MNDSEAEFLREMELLGFNKTPQLDIVGMPTIKSSELIKVRKIGSGQYGDVYEGKCRGQRVAIKYLKNFDPCQAPFFQAEIEIMSQNRNPHVVLLLGACVDSQDWAMVTEFCDHGDLEHLIYSKEKISLSKKIQFGIEICQGMSWLTGEDSKTLHKDLKPANVLIDASWHIKISDFGISTLESKGLVTGTKCAAGSPKYMSPEALENKTTTYKSDVYAFGILLWELMTQQQPFENHDNLECLKESVIHKNERPTQRQGLDPLIYNLCVRCWDADPEKRPSFNELIVELQSVRIDIFLPTTLCPIAGNLWRNHFFHSHKVRFMEFGVALSKFCNVKSEDVGLYLDSIKKLYQITANHEKPFSLQKFSNLLKWFGPLQEGDNNVHMFQNILKIMNKKYFFGLINSQQAENLLKANPNYPPGTFLVRLNSGESATSITEAPFTFSLILEDGSTAHIRALTSKHGGLWCKFKHTKVPAQQNILTLVAKLMELNLIGSICLGYPFERHLSVIYIPNSDDEEED